jgi:hypothetical protein
MAAWAGSGCEDAGLDFVGDHEQCVKTRQLIEAVGCFLRKLDAVDRFRSPRGGLR